MRLKEYILNFDPCEEMRLTHITTLSGFRGIVSNGSLVPARCKVFNDDFLYLFLGRPAYRATTFSSSSLTWNIPIGFVFKEDAIHSIERIHPFDTGAFHEQRYRRTFPPEAHLNDFDIGCDIEDAKRYVTAFYGGAFQYLRSRPSSESNFSNFDFELRGLSELARRPAGGDAVTGGNDERASTVEIQIRQELSINNCVDAIIVPDIILQEPLFVNAVKDWSLKLSQILIYTNIIGPTAEAWVGQFYQRLIDYYEKDGPQL